MNPVWLTLGLLLGLFAAPSEAGNPKPSSIKDVFAYLDTVSDLKYDCPAAPKGSEEVSLGAAEDLLVQVDCDEKGARIDYSIKVGRGEREKDSKLVCLCRLKSFFQSKIFPLRVRSTSKAFEITRASGNSIISNDNACPTGLKTCFFPIEVCQRKSIMRAA